MIKVIEIVSIFYVNTMLTMKNLDLEETAKKKYPKN